MNITKQQEENILKEARKILNHIMTKYGLEWEEKIIYKGFKKVDSKQIYESVNNEIYNKNSVARKEREKIPNIDYKAKIEWDNKCKKIIFYTITSMYDLRLKNYSRTKEGLFREYECSPYHFDYYEQVNYYQVPKDIYWSIYRKFEERLDILNIDLNKI